MKIAIVCLGYVGLGTGTCYAKTSKKVICIDIDTAKVENYMLFTTIGKSISGWV